MVRKYQGGYKGNGRSVQRKRAFSQKAYWLRKLIHLEMLVVSLLIAFFTGKRVGLVTAKEEILAVVQASVSNQDYGAGNEKLLELLTGEEKEKEDVSDFAEKSEPEVEGSVRDGKGSDNQGKNDLKAGAKAEAMAGATADAKEERTPEKDALRLALLWEEYPELLLVNKDHKLPEDYEVKLKKLPDGTNRADEMAYDALTTMLKAGRKEGLAFEICSSYRSVKRQQELLDEDINALMRKGYTYKEAYDEVTMETMPPGYSEHATGLAFDIVALDYQMLDEHQENTDESKWLRKHCAEYGFILRYPKDKEDITEISYESWHFRYVGEEAAAYIMEREITLEEYLEEYLEGELDILK